MESRKLLPLHKRVREREWKIEFVIQSKEKQKNLLTSSLFLSRATSADDSLLKEQERAICVRKMKKTAKVASFSN
jgi:hypothetical protein